MPAEKPMPSPGSLRSPRNRALEIGTTPAGFATGVPYDIAAGIPASAKVGLGQRYTEPAPLVHAAGGPVSQTVPFTLAGK